MDTGRRTRILAYGLIAAALFMMGCVLFIHFSKEKSLSNPAIATIPGQSVEGPKGQETQITEVVPVNAVPSDEEIEKSIQIQNERRRTVDAILADRKKRADAVRAEAIAASELNGGQEATPPPIASAEKVQPLTLQSVQKTQSASNNKPTATPGDKVEPTSEIGKEIEAKGYFIRH